MTRKEKTPEEIIRKLKKDFEKRGLKFEIEITKHPGPFEDTFTRQVTNRLEEAARKEGCLVERKPGEERKPGYTVPVYMPHNINP